MHTHGHTIKLNLKPETLNPKPLILNPQTKP